MDFPISVTIGNKFSLALDAVPREFSPTLEHIFSEFLKNFKRISDEFSTISVTISNGCFPCPQNR